MYRTICCRWPLLKASIHYEYCRVRKVILCNSRLRKLLLQSFRSNLPTSTVMSLLKSFVRSSHLLRPVIRSFSLSAQLLQDRTQTLFVGGLNWDTERNSLQEPFEKFGHVKSTRIVTNRDTGRSRGFGMLSLSKSAVSDRDAHADSATLSLTMQTALKRH